MSWASSKKMRKPRMLERGRNEVSATSLALVQTGRRLTEEIEANKSTARRKLAGYHPGDLQDASKG